MALKNLHKRNRIYSNFTMCYCKNFFHWENWQRVTDGTSKHFWLKIFPVSPSLCQTEASRTLSHSSITACPSPKRDLLYPLGLSPAYTSCWHCWIEGLKAQRGGMNSKWEENATAVRSSFETSQPFPQLRGGLHSTECTILHYFLTSFIP